MKARITDLEINFMKSLYGASCIDRHQARLSRIFSDWWYRSEMPFHNNSNGVG